MRRFANLQAQESEAPLASGGALLEYEEIRLEPMGFASVVAAASGHEVRFRRLSDSGGDRDTTPVTFFNCFVI